MKRFPFTERRGAFPASGLFSHAIAAVLLAAFHDAATADTYTWLASPPNGYWDTSSLNWSGGTGKWEDNASAPNNAIFGSSSQTAVTVPSGQTRLVGDLTVGSAAFKFQTGTISVAGTISTGAQTDFNGPLASGRADGSLHLSSNGKNIYLRGNNTQTSTVIDGPMTLSPGKDAVFGQVPANPADNIIVNADGVTLFGNGTFAINANRTLRIASGLTLKTASKSDGCLTYGNLVVAPPSSGLNYSTNTAISVTGKYSWGPVVFDPGAGRTNSFGRLDLADGGHATIKSGATLVSGVTDALNVAGDGSSFGTGKGKGDLLVEGGTLYAPQNGIRANVKSCGQVRVKNGGRIDMPNGDWRNGDGSRGKLEIGNGGEFAVKWIRLSESGSAKSEVFLNAGGVMRVSWMTVTGTGTCDFHLDGGTFRLLLQNSGLFNTGADWSNVRFLVEAGGAVLDTSDGWDIWWKRPLVSGAANDGGLTKTGSGGLILTAANSYNGATRFSGGNVQARADGALPNGTRLVLSDGCTVDFRDWDSSSARYSVNRIASVEGSGTLNNCANLHVTNAIAPSVSGTVAFNNPCELRGNYVVSGNASSCGLLKVASGQSISGLRLTLADASALDKGKRYGILATVSGSFSGQFDESALPDGWKIKYAASSATLSYTQPTTIIMR